MSQSTETRRSRRRRRAREGDRGAALVEFALISIPLFTILFGTIEFGWAFFQLNDVRHGAREGIRLVAVDADVDPAYDVVGMTQGQRMAQAACERMDDKDGVVVTITLIDVDGNLEYDVGDDAELTASKPLAQLTKVFDAVLSSVVLDETITTRLEQDPEFLAAGFAPSAMDDSDVIASWTCQ